jgi:hypothetical protein
MNSSTKCKHKPISEIENVVRGEWV